MEEARKLAQEVDDPLDSIVNLAKLKASNLSISWKAALAEVRKDIIGGGKAFKEFEIQLDNVGDTAKAVTFSEEFAAQLETEYLKILAEAGLRLGGAPPLDVPVKIDPILVLDDDEPIEDINQDIRDAIESEFKPIEIESMLKAPDIASIEDATQRQIAAQQEQLHLDKEKLRIMKEQGGSLLEQAALEAKIINDQRELNTLKAQGASETFAAQLGEQAVSTILENQRKTMEAKQSARRAAIDSIEDEAVKSRLLAREEKRAAREKLAAQLKEVVIQATIASLKEGNKIGKALADGGKAGALSLVASLPAFKTGVIDYNGAGTTTSDSNIVRISNSESVITARGTAKAPKLLEMINAGKVSDGDYLQTNIEKHSTVTRTKDVKFEVDYKRLAKEISDATYTQDLTRLAGEVIITNENALNREKIVIETRKITGKKWQ
jgi:protein required for attachment to host cells